VAIEEQQLQQLQHVALPQLYGAPAYGRPPRPIEPAARPFDPDALPLTAEMTDEERAFVATLPDRAWHPGGAVHLRAEDDEEGIRRSA
jgi:hypothetical protein